MTSELPPYLSVCYVKNNRGHVVWTFRHDIFQDILALADVVSPEHLPDEELYRLCFEATPERQASRAQHAAEAGRELETIVTIHDDDGQERQVDISEPASAFLLRRFSLTDREKLLCNPLYSTVEIELQVFDTSAGDSHSQDPLQSAVTSVLARTLYPRPDLPEPA